MIEFLVKNGADINATNSNGDTALHLAALNSTESDIIILKMYCK